MMLDGINRLVQFPCRRADPLRDQSSHRETTAWDQIPSKSSPWREVASFCIVFDPHAAEYPSRSSERPTAVTPQSFRTSGQAHDPSKADLTGSVGPEIEVSGTCWL
jgi:hypothetical protein